MDEALLQGVKLVTFNAPFATNEEAEEAQRLLGAIDWRREADLFGFVACNPTPESIRHASHVLDAEECRIGDERAVRQLWARDWPQQTLRFIRLQITPKPD